MTRETFDKEIDQMVNAGDYAALRKQARDLLYGSVAKGGEDGLAALQTKRQALQARLDEAVRQQNGFISRARRLQIEQELAKLRAAQAARGTGYSNSGDNPYGARNNPPGVPRRGAPAAPADQLAHGRAVVDQVQQALNDAQQAADEGGRDLANGIVDGFNAALSGGGLGGGLKALTGDMLSGLGQMFLRFAPPIALFGKIMNGLATAVKANPIFAGGAALIAGAALVTLGNRLSAASGGGSGSAGGGSFAQFTTSGQIAQVTVATGAGSAAIDTASRIVPAQPVNITVIGANDPTVQRGIADVVKGAQRRGLL